MSIPHHENRLHHENRPWGHFDWIFDSRGLSVNREQFLVKTLYVKPGARLSDQRHSGRSELWYVQTGAPVIYLEHADGRKEVLRLSEGGTVEIPKGTWHRLSAEGSDGPVRVTEIWRGEFLDENDIERRNDDYGRT